MHTIDVLNPAVIRVNSCPFVISPFPHSVHNVYPGQSVLNRLAQESSLARVNTFLGLPGPHPYLERAL
jgi:hypothetical protein